MTKNVHIFSYLILIKIFDVTASVENDSKRCKLIATVHLASERELRFLPSDFPKHNYKIIYS